MQKRCASLVKRARESVALQLRGVDTTKRKTLKAWLSLCLIISLLCGCSTYSLSVENTTIPESEPNCSAIDAETSVPVDSTFSIHFIDVGQADAALVSCDGEYMVIDGGNVKDSSLMYSVLKNAGVSHLAIVVGTHVHEDHIGGLAAVYQVADVDVTLCTTTTYDTEAFGNFSKYANKDGNRSRRSVKSLSSTALPVERTTSGREAVPDEE